MDFAFTDEQSMIAETVQGFFAENATSERTRAAMAEGGFDRPLWTSFCGELGLAGVALPEEFGGAGLGMVELAILAEAAGAQVAAIPLLGMAMASLAINAGGTQAQKEQWLPRIASGETIAVFAQASAMQEANGELSGTIDLVAHGAAADLIVVHSPAGCWIIETAAAGVSRHALTTMDQTRPLANIVLNGVACVPLADGAAALDAGRNAGYLCLAAEALGGAQAALDRTVTYARDRVQFGRAIGSFQAYKHRLADMMVEIEQARSAVYWAACTIDEHSDDQMLALHAAKAFCADTFFRCAGDMIQLHGGIGFTWEHDAHLFFKRARSIQTLLDGGDWHREHIAMQILGEAA